MHVKYFVFVAVILCLMIGANLMATPLSLDRAIETALANNKELKAQRLGIAVVDAERKRAGLWQQSNPEFEFEVVTDALTANTGEGTIRVGLAQEFELGGQRGARKKIADSRLDLANSELMAREQELRRDVTSAFYSLLLAQRKLGFVRFADSLATSLRDTAEVRFRNGFVPKSEFTFLDLDAVSSHSIVNKADAAVSESRIKLLSLLGTLADSALEVIGVLDQQTIDISEDSLVTLALSHRPEIVINRLGRNASDAGLQLALKERIPNASLLAFYARERSVFSADNFVGNTGSIQGLRDADHLFGIRLSLPLPLIDKRTAEISKFRAESSAIDAQGLALANQIRFEVRNAYRLFKTTERSVQLLEGIMPESDSLLQLLQVAYAQGRVTVSEYLTQKERLLNTRSSFLDAESDLIAAQRECERAVGLDWDHLRQGE